MQKNQNSANRFRKAIGTYPKVYRDWPKNSANENSPSANAESNDDQYIAAPMAAWLAEWPATGGYTYERLQLTLRRIPESIKEISETAEKNAIGRICGDDKCTGVASVWRLRGEKPMRSTNL